MQLPALVTTEITSIVIQILKILW